MPLPPPHRLRYGYRAHLAVRIRMARLRERQRPSRYVYKPAAK